MKIRSQNHAHSGEKPRLFTTNITPFFVVEAVVVVKYKKSEFQKARKREGGNNFRS